MKTKAANFAFFVLLFILLVAWQMHPAYGSPDILYLKSYDVQDSPTPSGPSVGVRRQMDWVTGGTQESYTFDATGETGYWYTQRYTGTLAAGTFTATLYYTATATGSTTLTIRPNAAGTYQQWSLTDSTHYGATSDQSDTTYVYVTGSTTLKETENLADTSQTGTINSVTACMRASATGSDAPTYQEFTEAASNTNVASKAINKPAGTQNGDLLIAVWCWDGTVGTITPPSGWTQLYVTSSGTDCTLGIWYKIASSEPASHTWSWTTTQMLYAFILRITGHDSTNPIHTSGTGTGTSNAPTCPTVTTTVSDCLILRLFGADDDDITVDSGYPTDHTGITVDKSGTAYGSSSGGAAYKTQASAGATGTAAFSLTASEQWVGATIAIAPTPAPEKANIIWISGATEVESGALAIGRGAFTDYSEVRTTNPNTGQAWTWTEVNALEIGSRASTLGAGETIQVSEYWIIVTYSICNLTLEVAHTSPDGQTVTVIGTSTTENFATTETVTSKVIDITTTATPETFNDERLRLRITWSSGSITLYWDSSSTQAQLSTPSGSPPIPEFPSTEFQVAILVINLLIVTYLLRRAKKSTRK